MSAQIDAIKHGYAYVEMNERGHFFSEGTYDILGPPLTDGADAIDVDDVAALVERERRAPSGAHPPRNGRWAWRRWELRGSRR